MDRIQKEYIISDLNKKMVFLTGPRQVGKTWLAKDILKLHKNTLYLNYDSYEDRQIIEGISWLDSVELLIFDELHKMPRWKNYLKGIYDTKLQQLKILVTGSARLDIFRQSGDSLAGRYFRHRLLPVTLCEIPNPEISDVDKLIKRSGFPEPFLADNDTEAARWRLQYIDGLIRTDVLDFENVHDLRAMQTVLEILRRSVGSPVSYSSIARDALISPNTVKRYIQIFDSLYIIFTVSPFTRNIARSLLKEPKIYFYDTGLVLGDDGVKFENLVALSLLKYVFALEDYEGKKAELQYIRTRDGREVDFCLVINGIPAVIIEVKLSEKEISKSLFDFTEKYGYKGIQIVKNLRLEYKKGNVSVRKGFEYLRELWI